MAKRTTGKAYFEVLGRSERSRHYPGNYKHATRINWPLWARRAYARGWTNQGRNYA